MDNKKIAKIAKNLIVKSATLIAGINNIILRQLLTGKSKRLTWLMKKSPKF